MIDLADGSLAAEASAEPIIIALQTLRPGGDPTLENDWVTYDKLTAADFRTPADIEAAAPTSGAFQAHNQLSIKRSGEGVDYLSNDNVTVVPRLDYATANAGAVPSATWPDDGFRSKRAVAPYPFSTDPEVDDLNEDDKTDTAGTSLIGNPELATFQIPMANRPFFSVAELAQVLMVGFTDERDTTTGEPIGDFPTRLDLIFADAGASPFLNWNATQVTGDIDGDGDFDLSYAHLMMDQFTTLSPRYDGVDNNDDDGDDDPTTSVDEEEEQFVFGTVNINTMPPHLLGLSMPTPLELSPGGPLPSQQEIAEQIVLLRRAGNDDGIAGMGELMALPDLPAGSDPILENNNLIYGPGSGVGGDAYASDSRFDLYPMDEALVAATGGLDAVKYDATIVNNTGEQWVQLYQFLTQAYTTRSDLFAAHLLIKGYKSEGGGTLGPLVESGRWIVIFSRAELTSPASRVQVLGVYRYE